MTVILQTIACMEESTHVETVRIIPLTGHMYVPLAHRDSHQTEQRSPRRIVGSMQGAPDDIQYHAERQ